MVSGMMSFGVLMMLFGLLILIGVVVLIVWAVIRMSEAGRSRGSGDASARQILDQRYARGEIDGDEYQRTKRELG